MTFSVAFDGDLGIRRIQEIRSSLIAAFEADDSIVVKVAASGDPDISFIQLIESARVQAQLDGKTIALAAPATGGFLDVLTRGGFLAAGSAEDAAFWLHGADAR